MTFREIEKAFRKDRFLLLRSIRATEEVLDILFQEIDRLRGLTRAHYLQKPQEKERAKLVDAMEEAP